MIHLQALGSIKTKQASHILQYITHLHQHTWSIHNSYMSQMCIQNIANIFAGFWIRALLSFAWNSQKLMYPRILPRLQYWTCSGGGGGILPNFAWIAYKITSSMLQSSLWSNYKTVFIYYQMLLTLFFSFVPAVINSNSWSDGLNQAVEITDQNPNAKSLRVHLVPSSTVTSNNNGSSKRELYDTPVSQRLWARSYVLGTRTRETSSRYMNVQITSTAKLFSVCLRSDLKLAHISFCAVWLIVYIAQCVEAFWMIDRQLVKSFWCALIMLSPAQLEHVQFHSVQTRFRGVLRGWEHGSTVFQLELL